METMILEISLPDDVGRALRSKAKTNGKEVAEYVETIIAADIHRKSFDEIVAPFRHEVEESGISDDEFDRFVDEIREEVYQEQLAANRE